jgi:1-acyl-sn-glycerol-3-phosphate acyltransferase
VSTSDTPDGQGALPKEELHDLQEAVSALREEIQQRFFSGSSPLLDPGRWAREVRDDVRARVARLDILRTYEDLRQRFSVFGMEERSAEVDDFGLDPAYLRQAQGLLDFLYERWWRVHVAGIGQIPRSPRVLFVANRSGILPYDGLMLAHAVEREHPDHFRPRFLVADWLVSLPFAQPVLARLGGVRACPENASRLLTNGTPVIAFPEGQKGALKPFRDRYRLQRFGRGGFVSLAIRHHLAVVPTAVVGAEEAHPVLFRPRFLGRLLGAPLPVTATFPHLGPLGLVPLPSQWVIVFGEPFLFDAVDPERAEDPLYVNRTREIIRGSVQSLVEEGLRLRRSVWTVG